MRSRNQREAFEQAEVLKWAQKNLATYPMLRFLHHSPNGGLRNAVVAGQLKAMGVRRGFPDLILPFGVFNGAGEVACGLAIEMKVDASKPTKEQDEWLAHLRDQGWITSLCYSAQEAIYCIRAYLAGQFGRE